MTEKEVNEAFEELRAQGADDNEILGCLYLMYQDNEIDTEQLRDLIDILGYEFTEEFEAMSEEDKHEKGYKTKEEAQEDVSKEDIEEAKEFGDSEDEKEEVKEEKTEEKSDDGEKVEEKEEKEEVKDDSKESEDESEEDEKKKAMNMFFNK